MNTILIKAFGVCTTESNVCANKDDERRVMVEMFKRGFIVPRELVNDDMINFIDSESLDYNSTFYKTWKQMSSKSRFEQLIDQLFHYASTYGTNFTAEPFTLNDGDRSDVPDLTKYKVISVATVEDVMGRCLSLVKSGIALSTEMVKAVVEFIASHTTKLPSDFTVDDVQNREALCQLCDSLNIRPTTGEGLIRWMIYKATGNALVVKDKKTIWSIESFSDKIDFNEFNDHELIELATVFFRYKPLILAFRSNKKNKKPINKIRKLANYYHIPIKEGFWQTLLSTHKTPEEIANRVKDIDNYKLVSLIETLIERESLNNSDDNRMFFIRNGKAWIDKNGEKKEYDQSYYNMAFTILYSTLVKRLSAKAGTVKFPTDIDIACPVSEKQFAGSLPYGSSYNFSSHNYFGIYWKEEDGARDFDLSFVSTNGNRIAWNSYFRDSDDILFSGDMTTANPCATEILYFKGNTDKEGILYANLYNGNDGSKFRYFFGKQEMCDFGLNYMVDPNSICFEEWTNSKSTQNMLGVVCDNKLFLTQFGVGNSIVSSSNYSEEKFKTMKRKLLSTLSLKQVLLDAGFIEWKDSMKTDDNPNPQYDLTKLNKDTLINLFQLA